MRFFECLLLLLLLLCFTSISTHFRSRKKMPTNLELRRPQHHFGKAQKPSRAVKGRHDFLAPNSAVLTLKRAAEIYGANYAAHSTISERPRNHQGRLKDELRRPQHYFGNAQKPSRAVKGRTTPPTDHFGKAQKPSRAVKGRRDFSAPISAELRRPQHHFEKAQKPSRAVKGRHDFSAPNSAVLTLKRAAEIYGA
ncbi:hypothetical protein YC2023_121916 [Brassica napus]